MARLVPDPSLARQVAENDERQHAQHYRERVQETADETRRIADAARTATENRNRAVWWRWGMTTAVAVVALVLSVWNATKPAPTPEVRIVLVPSATVPAPSAPATLAPMPSTPTPEPALPQR